MATRLHPFAVPMPSHSRHHNQKEGEIPLYDIDFDGGLPFFIRPVQAEISRELQNEQPHRHRYTEIIWIKSGRGFQKIDENVLPIRANTFYLIKQGQIHDFLEGHQLKGMLIRYTNDFLLAGENSFLDKFYTSLYGFIAEQGAITLKATDARPLEWLLHQLYDEFCHPASAFGRKDIIRHFLATFLLKLERSTREIGRQQLTHTPNLEKETFVTFSQLVEQHFLESQNVAFFAERIGISTRRLSDIIMELTGKGAKSYIIEKRITEAKRLLTYTNMPIKEIAFQLGFSTEPYFSRQFKELTGKTPNTFRLKAK